MLIVEAVTANSPAEQAGIQVGDQVISYDNRPLLSPDALLALEENTFGQETATIRYARGGETQEATVPIGQLGLQTRPILPPGLLPDYDTGRATFERGEYAEAAHQWSNASERVEDAGIAAWLWSRVGASWEKASDWSQAVTAYAGAWEQLVKGEDTAASSQTATALGRCHQSRSAWKDAQTCYQQSSEINRRAGLEMWTARSLNNLGTVAAEYGDLQAAQDNFTHALQIKERLAPESLDVALSVNSLGVVTIHRGDLQAAQDYFTRALKIRERLAPDSLDVAASLNNLGNIAWRRGNLDAALDYYTFAAQLHERFVPESTEIAASFNNLGVVAWQRGNLEAALDWLTRALQIRERLAPESVDLAASFNNLGNIAWQQGNLELAKESYTRAAQLYERLAPESVDLAASLTNLGNIAQDRGDLSAAQEHYSHALRIYERLAPESVDVAASLSGLGNVAWRRGNLDTAQDWLTRTLQIYDRLAPNALDHAVTLTQLGRILLCRHQPHQALPLLEQAVQILEQQRLAIAAGDARALLLAQHTTEFTALIQGYLALEQPADAFTTLERSRARSLLELLTERRLDFASDAPTDLLQEQQIFDRQRAKIYDQLAKLSAAAEHAEHIEALHQQLRDLERRQQELTARIRAASPHYASLQYPEPLDCKAAQAQLQSGTLLLSFLVDEEQTFLFAVTNKTTEFFPLPIGRAALQERVRAFRDALDWNQLDNRTKQAASQAAMLGRELYIDLVSPAVTGKRDLERLLFCPDGPLHTLPFGALVTNPQGRPKYLGAVWPLHTILSVTLYAQTVNRNEEPVADFPLQPSAASAEVAGLKAKLAAPMRRLLAFGDPFYPPRTLSPALARSGGYPPKTNEASSELALLQTRGLTLGPLPHSREEVESIGRIFDGQTVLKLGVQATKTAAIAESGDADLLHFACHGWLDERAPLSSGLVLSQPESTGEDGLNDDNGMLQAWEILSKMRIKADLVVLSACRTGLGQELRGEGLIGLTRAFTYAGARSVLVSLWEVNDASTSALMQAFYRNLREGSCKAEALQAAIAEMGRNAEWRHPYFWSGFVLSGDGD